MRTGIRACARVATACIIAIYRELQAANQAIQRANHYFVRFIEALLVFLVLASVAIGMAQVILLRFGKALSEIKHLSRLFVLWLTFLGAAVATHRQKHIRIDVLANILSERLGRILLVLVNLVGLVLALFFFLGGREYFFQREGGWSFEDNPLWDVAMMVGFGLVALQFALRVLDECLSTQITQQALRGPNTIEQHKPSDLPGP